MPDCTLWTINGPQPVVLVTIEHDDGGLIASVDQIGIVDAEGEQPWTLIGEPVEMLEAARDLASTHNCDLRVRLGGVRWCPD